MRKRERQVIDHIYFINSCQQRSGFNKLFYAIKFILGSTGWKSMFQSLFSLFSQGPTAIIKMELKKEIFNFQNEPLGTVSQDFLNDPSFVDYVSNPVEKNLKFWRFLQTNQPSDIEKDVKEQIAKYKEGLTTTGIDMTPIIYSRRLIRSVYLSNNAALIDIFARNLPFPSLDIFRGYPIPEIVMEKHKEVANTLLRFQNNPKVVEQVIKSQRIWRNKQRMREEKARIENRSEWRDLPKSPAEDLIREASTIYMPKCANERLAQRIIKVAKGISLFSVMNHLTSVVNIQNIFDDCLYGRRTLHNFYKMFSPSALFNSDIYEGDGNVICMGPRKIDPIAMKENTLKLVFDLEKLSSSSNPTIFYKQRDFGFSKESRENVFIPLNVNGKPLTFYSSGKGSNGFSTIILNGDAFFTLPNYSLISYNLRDIHQIFILNFFRFLDANNKENGKILADQIYAELNNASDEELVQFLKSVGEQLSITSEFNFYGAHQIDFSTLTEITLYRDGENPHYTLNISQLIDSLNQNNLTLLHQAKKHLPKVFQSTRFLDYLIKHTVSEPSKAELHQLYPEIDMSYSLRSFGG